jgi:hypothetical protein
MVETVRNSGRATANLWNWATATLQPLPERLFQRVDKISFAWRNWCLPVPLDSGAAILRKCSLTTGVEVVSELIERAELSV